MLPQPAELGSGDRGDDAAGEHQRDRPRPERVVGDLGRGEAVVLRRAAIDADQEGADRQAGQRAGPNSKGGHASAEGSEQRANHEADATAVAGHQPGGRRHRCGGAEEHRGDRRGRKLRIGSDLPAGEPADGHHQDRRRLEQRLGGGEYQNLSMRRCHGPPQ